ncbi:MAG: hypothetical protein ACOH5I_12240 [Oligoflexus sp.]
MKVFQTIIGLCLFLTLSACGSDDYAFSKSEPRVRLSRPLESNDSQAIEPIKVTVLDDGTVALNNRLEQQWDGVGFVGSQDLDIIPVE